ncbi:flagellar modification protein B [Shinella kummerowiae]|jgi:CMP-N,N'-diacetyllegionaminic acid synthase|uniref:Flagellar modification protein B n=1 Tax=Shinella kummerowiae TaxID=417745 RepID=A0A6N8SNQ2_9HYPH|nr:acylneuraminate cytidylyltransferase family protein [Shinella kummerowiae]MXN48876.1 flagellar modification protein B [Shinella kummerowiae]
MTETPKFICTICARGGSKGVPGKNIRMLMGKPLIGHSIAQAKATGLFAAIAISSDSEEILGVAHEYGADLLIKRPDELASDTAGKLPAILHALAEAEARLGVEADYLIDLDATSPLRLPEDIQACANLLIETGTSCVITGTPAHRSPYFNLVERTLDGTVQLSKQLSKPVLRRQDSPECYDMNASIYGWRRDALSKDPKVFYPDTQLYVMPRNRSADIDEEMDFAIVKMIMQQREAK